MCLRLYWLCYGVTLVWVILLDYCREAHRMWPWMTKLPLKMKNGAWLKGLMVGWWEWRLTSAGSCVITGEAFSPWGLCPSFGLLWRFKYFNSVTNHHLWQRFSDLIWLLHKIRTKICVFLLFVHLLSPFLLHRWPYLIMWFAKTK